jgi:DNA-binding transcriptional regulator WhiA
MEFKTPEYFPAANAQKVAAAGPVMAEQVKEALAVLGEVPPELAEAARLRITYPMCQHF